MYKQPELQTELKQLSLRAPLIAMEDFISAPQPHARANGNIAKAAAKVIIRIGRRHTIATCCIAASLFVPPDSSTIA